MAEIDWKQIKINVLQKIDCLQVLDVKLPDDKLSNKIRSDLIEPIVTKLAEFCACVEEINEQAPQESS